jgi:hypothetical protein
MKNRFFSSASFLLILFISSKLHAQQSLFNAPSGQMTKAGEHFAQEQVNFTRGFRGVSNFTYDYGLAENIEVGFNVLGISTLKKHNGSENLDVMTNAQYFLKVSNDTQISLGVQLGISYNDQFAYYTFINLRQNFGHSDGYFVVGAFIANDKYLEYGQGNWHIGTEIPLIEDHLHLIADYLNGDTSISVGVVGLGYFVSKDWMVSLGAQFPSFRSAHTNDTGGVIEITYNPVDRNY